MQGGLFLRRDDQLLCIGKGFDPAAEGVPLLQLVGFSGVIDVDQGLVIHGAGTHLVVAGGKELDHVVPVLLIFSFLHIF